MCFGAGKVMLSFGHFPAIQTRQMLLSLLAVVIDQWIMDGI